MDLTTMLMLRGLRAPADNEKVAARLAAPVSPPDEVEPEEDRPEEDGASGNDDSVDEDGSATSSPSPGDMLKWATEEFDSTATDGRNGLALLGALDRYLNAHLDRPEPDDFVQERRRLLQEYLPDPTDPPKTYLPPTAAERLAGVRSLLTQALVNVIVNNEPDFATASAITRLLLVLDIADVTLLADDALTAAQANGSALIWDRLHRRFVLLPPGLPIPQAKVDLVREATIGDLAVVRSEWSCYRLGEIATITNVLAGEKFEQTQKRIREESVTDRTLTERIESSERTDEDRTSIELSREVDRAVSNQGHVEGSVNVAGQYGLVKFGASASGGFSSSYEENIRTANKTAHEIVSKAVSRVETRVREERIRTVTTRSVDTTGHLINNTVGEAKNRRGVYRWVDRVDRYQIFHYPERLMLEFQIPEPAQYLRYRLSQPAPTPAGGIDQPPAWNVDPSGVTAATIGELTTRYRASNVPPVPDQARSVVAAKKLTPTPPTPEPPAVNRAEVYNTPAMADSMELTLPRGYGATSAVATGVAMPMRANWRVESTRDIVKLDDKKGIEGFHHITMSVTAGRDAPLVVHHPSRLTPPPGLAFFTVQLAPNEQGKDLGSEDRAKRQFGDSVATLKGDLKFTAPITDKLTVAVDVAGASSAIFSVEVTCKLTDEASSEWRNSAYDALFAAWTNWNEQWRAQQAATTGPRLSAVDSTSPTRNRELITEELKRQVISWLLDEQTFAGRDAMAAPESSTPKPPWPRFDITKTLASAATIQFLEQAFEWNNLTYIAYPYYWARSSEWDDLNEIAGADATFVQFLRAGTVRVVVPARPAFVTAVLLWLIWQIPFLPGPLPLPGDDLYVSVAQEIFDLTQPPDDGVPGDTWEAKAPTTLLWLDTESEEPPRNTSPQLGYVTDETPPPLCAPVADDAPDHATENDAAENDEV